MSPLANALAVILADPTAGDLRRLKEWGRNEPHRNPAQLSLRTSFRRRLAEVLAEDRVSREMERCDRLGLELISWGDPDYPPHLFELTDPPPVLYLSGTGPWPPPEPITVVGSRRSSGLGRAFAREVGAHIAACGGTVLSGLAVGIDQAALDGGLASGGYAILGCGLDRVYPPGSTTLTRELKQRGRVFTEFPVGTPPYPANFPRRNRLLAALSRVTVVIEADLRSGSLITAHHALELGRDVFAVPGNIDRPTSRGTNRLIRDGAHPLIETGDLELVLPRAGGAQGLLELLERPASPDELAAQLGRPMDDVLLELVDLEVEGRIVRLASGSYQRWPTTRPPAGSPRRRIPPETSPRRTPRAAGPP